MKISKSKQELARIISENGGWKAKKAGWSAQDGDAGQVSFFKIEAPTYSEPEKEWMAFGDSVYCYDSRIEGCKVIKNFHQTILSRDEYFHLYPAPDADGWIEHDGKHEPAVATSGLTLWCKWSDGLEQSHEANMVDWIDDSDVRIIAYRLHKPEKYKPEFCESVMRSIPEPEAKPTIEQLAADYHNAKGFAERKQREADDAKAVVEAKLKALELAGEAIGLLLSPINAKKEPELVITDWRDLLVGDVIRCIGDWQGEETHGVELSVDDVEFPGYGGDLPIRVVLGNGDGAWGKDFKFIRRP